METSESLDADIRTLKARLSTLHAHRANLSSILLAQPHLSTHLQLPSSEPKATRSGHNTASRAQSLIANQKTRTTSNIYRACASTTAYKVHDPDPRAPNGGNILGLSIDVSLRGKFVETYHVLLALYTLQERQQEKLGQEQEQEQDHNEDQEEGEETNGTEESKNMKLLKIHKHTIPPSIPLQQLAHKYLPTHSQSPKAQAQKQKQDLVRFARALRQELTSWHLRRDALVALKTAARLEPPDKHSNGPSVEEGNKWEIGNALNAFTSDDDEPDTPDAESQNSDQHPSNRSTPRITAIEADAAVRQVTVTWSDRHRALMRVNKDGRIEKAVCRARNGERDVLQSERAVGSLAGLVQRLEDQGLDASGRHAMLMPQS